MKQLTQAEFDALPSDRPLDVRVDGVPAKNKTVLIWEFECWHMSFIDDDNEWCGWGDRFTSIDQCPIYHKLPADYV